MDGFVSLVTGASRGIGRAVALCLSGRGDTVIINYQSSEAEAGSVCEEIRSAGGRAEPFCADVSSVEDVKKMFAHVKGKFGRLDVLVNNAGICRDGSVLAMSDSDFEDVLAVNLAGPFRCVREGVRLLRKSAHASIVNIGSSGALKGNPGQANYAASKGGVLSMTRSLSRELAPRGIRVNAVVPGFVKTGMTSGLDEGHWRRILEDTPTGIFSEPEDIAWAVEFLTSPRARNITGQILVVDGGRI